MSIVESNNNSGTDFIDIDLTPIRRKKLRINGDNTKILELNTTDIGIVSRLSEFYPKLDELQKQFNTLEVKFDNDGNLTDESFFAAGETVKEIDEKMREYVDAIFDSNVSELCAPDGNMFDPINGSYRFEYIIEALANVYSDEIQKNIEKRKETIGKHTAKYKGRKKKEDN